MKDIVQEIRRGKGSLYAFLIKVFAGLICLIVLLGLLLFSVSELLRQKLYTQPQSAKLLSQEDLLKKEDYGSIHVGNSLGKTGYFEVLDENARVLYCSDQKRKNAYTKDSLRYISDLDADTAYLILPYWSGRQQEGYLLLQYTDMPETVLTDTEDAEEALWGSEVLTGMSLLDSKRNVIFTDMEMNNEKLSKKELQFLLDNEEDGDPQAVLQKHSYTTDSGQERCLLIHMESIYRMQLRAARGINAVLISVFIAAVFVSVIAAAFLVVARLKQPLKRLMSAMDGFAAGQRETVQGYQGPREFVQVIDTFNDMEEKLKESEQQQLHLQEQKQKMLADISHDLKTPITVIQGYVDAMKDGLISKDEQKKYLDIISHKTQMLSELINTFSDYSRLEHPDYQPEMTQGDLVEYFREYVAQKYEELTIAGDFVEVDIQSSPVVMPFDHMQLKRVFENIGANTLKYTEKGTTLSFSIHEKQENQGRSVVLEIGDDGPGIPDGLREHVFDPFVTGDEARTRGKGTGLGMAIAKEIVSMHGGTICLSDSKESPAGTCYRIVLPVPSTRTYHTCDKIQTESSAGDCTKG